MSFHVPNERRVRTGEMASDDSYGNNGAFEIRRVGNSKRPHLFIIASDGVGWEHVSVSTQYRCPTWDEMCCAKSIFWDAEDCVVQFHPPRSEYVNNHPFCLHLWRPTAEKIPMPPSILVGI